MILRGESGVEVDLASAKEIARGGEARIVEVAGSQKLVAKIFTAHDPQRERKLRAMLGAPPIPDGQFQSIVWPRELLFDRLAKCAGFVMARVENAVSLAEIRQPGERQLRAHGLTYDHLAGVAQNVAAAFELAHARGYVIGDVSDKNILVLPDARILLIDADSFQVAGPDGDVFHCTVATPEFTPPESQRQSLTTLRRDVSSDGFGLAVILYYLLMEGYHPFQGRSDEEHVTGLDQHIRIGAFAHSTRRDVPRLQAPRLAPKWELLPTRLRHLFVRAFDDGGRDPSKRPSPAEWKSAIVELRRTMRKCADQPTIHASPGHLSECYWCARSKAIGRDFYEKAPAKPRVAKLHARPLGAKKTTKPKRPGPTTNTSSPGPIATSVSTGPVAATSSSGPSSTPSSGPTSSTRLPKNTPLWQTAQARVAVAIGMLGVGLVGVISLTNASDAQCLASEECRLFGRCKADGSSCKLDCRASPLCTDSRRCSDDGVTCVVGPRDCLAGTTRVKQIGGYACVAAAVTTTPSGSAAPAVLKARGDACNTHSECAGALSCKRAICGGGQSPAGSQCSKDAECEPEYSCKDATCRRTTPPVPAAPPMPPKPGAENSWCQGDTDCERPLVCKSSTCSRLRAK